MQGNSRKKCKKRNEATKKFDEKSPKKASKSPSFDHQSVKSSAKNAEPNLTLSDGKAT